MTDNELLAKYSLGSDEAFAELVRRNLGWVYSSAKRRVRDAHLAEDVTQAVFIVLARKGRDVTGHGLSAWLFNVLNYTAARAVRGESRRVAREDRFALAAREKAQATPLENAEWRELAPILDEIVGRLAAKDREAILLRFYRHMEYAEVGSILGITGEAARKRIERALLRLRELATAKGLSIPAVAVATAVMSVTESTATASGLAAITTSASLTGNAAIANTASTSLADQAISMLTASKFKIAAIVAVCVAGIIVGGIVLNRASKTDQLPKVAMQAGAPASTMSPQPTTTTAPATKPIDDYIKIYSSELFRTSVLPTTLAAAIQETMKELGNWTNPGTDRAALPSMRGSAQDWKDEQGNMIAAVAMTEFEDKSGVVVRVQRIMIANEPTIVLLDSNPADHYKLFNTLSAKLLEAFKLEKASKTPQAAVTARPPIVVDLTALMNQMGAMMAAAKGDTAEASKKIAAVIASGEAFIEKYPDRPIVAELEKAKAIFQQLQKNIDAKDQAAIATTMSEIENRLGRTLAPAINKELNVANKQMPAAASTKETAKAAPAIKSTNDYILPYSSRLFRTTLAGQAVGEAIQATMNEMGNWIDQGNGGISLPSMRQGSSSWKDKDGAGVADRFKTDFEDADGKKQRIQVITIAGESPLVILDSQSIDPNRLFNTLSNNLARVVARDQFRELNESMRDLGDRLGEIMQLVSEEDLATASERIDSIVTDGDAFVQKYNGRDISGAMAAGMTLLRELGDAIKSGNTQVARTKAGQLRQSGRKIGTALQAERKNAGPLPQPPFGKVPASRPATAPSTNTK